MRRLGLAGIAVSLALGLIAVGWLAWISTSPRYWFPDAYAAKGPTGDRGPRGSVGPEGPPGPVGPDAADAISALQSDLEDVTSRLDDLESSVTDLQDETGTSTLETDVLDVQQKVNNMCDELSLSDGELYDIYLA